MERRALLRAAGAASAGLFAGCTGVETDPGGSPSDDRTESPTTSTSPSASPSPTVTEPTLESKNLEVRSVECGTGENRADASVSPTGEQTPGEDGSPPTHVVTVTGTIDGSNTCHTARLAAVDAKPDADTLRVEVESHVPDSEETPVCGECIVDIDYEATVELAGGYYGVVVVVHGGEQVAEIPLPE